MANFEKKKIYLSSINGGERYENGDIVTADAINVPIEGIGYAQEVAEQALEKANAITKKYYLHQLMYSIPNGGALNSNNKYLEVFVINTIPTKTTNFAESLSIITGRGSRVPLSKSFSERANTVFSSDISGTYDVLCAIQTGGYTMSIVSLSSSGLILVEEDLTFVGSQVKEYDL